MNSRPRGSIGHDGAMVRLSPEKGHSSALGGETCGEPMSADVGLVQHLSSLSGAS